MAKRPNMADTMFAGDGPLKVGGGMAGFGKPMPSSAIENDNATASDSTIVSETANNNINNSANVGAGVPRYKDERMKTMGLRVPVWVADEWAAWCKAHNWAIGPTAAVALVEYIERHKGAP